MNMDNWSPFISLIVVLVILFYRKRDYYVTIYENRNIKPGEFGKGKVVVSKNIKCFDDYLAARAYFDWTEAVGSSPSYEDHQVINYLYAVPAHTTWLAIAKMTKQRHLTAKLLSETPYSTLSALKKHWDAERRARLE